MLMLLRSRCKSNFSFILNESDQMQPLFFLQAGNDNAPGVFRHSLDGMDA